MNLRRQAVLSIAAVCVASGMAACSSSNDQPEDPQAASFTTCDELDLSTPPDEPVTIRTAGSVGSEGFAAWFAMAVAPEEYRPNYGTWYELDNQVFTDPAQRVTALQAGQVDGVITSLPAPVTMAESGIEVRMVAMLLGAGAGSYNEGSYVARADSGIETLADVEGKTVGIPSLTGTSAVLARTAIEAAGGDPEKVTFVNIPPAEQVQAVESGTVDVVLASQRVFLEPALAAGTVVELGGEGIGLHELDGIDYIEMFGLAMSKEFLDEQPSAVCAYLADYRSMLQWLREDIGEARQVFLDEELVAIPADAYLASTPFEFPEGDARPVLDYYVALGKHAERYGFIEDGSAEAMEELVWSGLGTDD